MSVKELMMKNRNGVFIVSLVSCLAAASPSFASGFFFGSGSNSCGRQLQLPIGGSYIPAQALGTQDVSGTAGLVRCARFAPSCTVDTNAIATFIDTGAAGAECQVGIYRYVVDPETVNHVEPVLRSDVFDCSSSGAKVSVEDSVTLTEGVEYYECWAASVTSTLKWSTATGDLLPNIPNEALSQCADPAQFNSNCTSNEQDSDCIGLTNPYACCTGAGTGTCTGPQPYACCTGAGTGTCTGLQDTMQCEDLPVINSAALVTLTNAFDH